MIQPDNLDVTDKCVVWEFNQLFDFSDRGLMSAKLRNKRYACDDSDSFENRSLEDNLLWIPLLAILISAISFWQLTMYFYGMSRHLDKLQYAYDKRIKDLKKKKEKEDSSQLDSSKLMAKYKKTEIENRRWKLLQSGIDPGQLSYSMMGPEGRQGSSD